MSGSYRSYRRLTLRLRGATLLKKTILAGLTLIAVTTLVVNAQAPASFPTIVVFANNVRFQDFAPDYRADDRAGANPVAWGYLDRGVAGAVQSLERRNGFRAEHVFSHAIHGFSARLTARQISQLESDSMIKYVEADGTMNIVAQTLP